MKVPCVCCMFIYCVCVCGGGQKDSLRLELFADEGLKVTDAAVGELPEVVPVAGYACVKDRRHDVTVVLETFIIFLIVV